MRLVQSFVLMVCAYVGQSALAQTVNLPSFGQQISSAFSANSFPSSIALSGNANWTAGSQTDSGTLRLQVSVDGSTNESWSFSTISHSFAQGPLNYSGFSRSCAYTDAKGNQRVILGPNCQQSLPWFCPSFVLQPAYAAVLTVADQSSEADAAQGLAKLVYSVASPAASSNSRTPPVPDFAIYYDVKTALPRRLVYQQALDTDDSRGVEVAIEYSSYGLESGYMLPHHLQRYMQHTLNADFMVSAATIQ